MITCYHVFFRGRVQGVCFRAFCKSVVDEFNKLNKKVTGFVRNLENGEVELLLQGEEGIVRKVFERIRKGNDYCSISEINLRKEDPQKKYEDFIILY